MLIDRGTFEILLGIAMLAVGALVIGSIRLFRSGKEERRKAWLMLTAALVLLANVLIWTV